jgi:hypothetical protein
MTLSHLRRTLHAELRHIHDEYDRHRREHACPAPPCPCLARARFQERIRTLNFALEQAGGRKMDESYQWGPVEGA